MGWGPFAYSTSGVFEGTLGRAKQDQQIKFCLNIIKSPTMLWNANLLESWINQGCKLPQLPVTIKV
ncbi:hypothetical protein STHE1630_00351 [Streptococcus thermophilus CNCM I-1630]|nr:hypothetical protein STHE1630_00351 [Streptococcus thermophilus CNCM I-1630]